jgi:hypothetical protein
MKHLFVIICMLFSILHNHLFAQEIDTAKIKFDKKPLFVFDDTILLTDEELQAIDPLDVQELVVIKDNSLENYIKRYGSMAENGVVLIYSKDFVAMRWFNVFSDYNKRLKKMISKSNVHYLNYSVYLGKEKLNDDFFDGLEKRLENYSIKKIKYCKIKDNTGKIIISTKPYA